MNNLISGSPCNVQKLVLTMNLVKFQQFWWKPFSPPLNVFFLFEEPQAAPKVLQLIVAVPDQRRSRKSTKFQVCLALKIHIWKTPWQISSRIRKETKKGAWPTEARPCTLAPSWIFSTLLKCRWECVQVR